LLTAFPVHEFAHAWSADRFGDTTPRANGRLTLNPLAHLDPIGTLMMILVGFGWAKPVPVNPYALQKRSSAAPMLVSLAGPMSNLLMAIIASIPFRVGLVSTHAIKLPTGLLPSLPWFLTTFIYINLLLMLFNLIPLFPLDGEKVLEYFLPPAGVRILDTIRPYSPIILMAILFVLPMIGINLLGTILIPALTSLTRLLIGA
ncbi:MAG: site-2 protease family protein, partial [Anaerolineae bacterium]|nr:site-2 protease family protein [Anaerolineae bacterium]